MMKNIIILLVFLTALAIPAFAEQTIASCGMVINSSDTYVLNSTVTDDVYAECVGVYSNDVVIDCQGYSFEGAGLIARAINSYGHNLVVKNCMFNAWADTVLNMEDATGNYIFNNTFNNTLNGLSVLSESDNSNPPLIENNTFNVIFQTGIGLYDAAIVRNNYFINVAGDIEIGTYYIGYYENSSFYNNYFDNALQLYVQDGLGFNRWNTSSQYGVNIIGNNVVGGNYYGLCTDNDCNGFCDNPVVINENNTDYLPLSNCHVNPPIPPAIPVSCNASIISATGNFIGNKETLNHKCVDASHVNYFGNTNVCYGTDCCDIAVNRTEICGNGCDLKRGECKGDPSVGWLFGGLIIFVIVVLLIAGWRYL